MAPFSKLKSTFHTKYWAVAFGGTVFALLVWQLMTLEFRYALAVSGGIICLSMALMAIRHIDTFLIYALIFNIPFARFGKWLFVQTDVVVAAGISLGMAELLLVLAYGVWFAQIFIARKEPLPRLNKLDYFILLLLLAQVLSLVGAPRKELGMFDIVYNIKHALIYFFIAHKIRRPHLPWVAALLMAAVLVMSPIALYERVTGNVGIGNTKANVLHENFEQQHEVPGLEQIRAEGTTMNSHTLGIFYLMLLPVPFVLLMMRHYRPTVKFLLAGILVMGLGGLIVTFSRAAWMSFGLSSLFALAVIALAWKQRRALLISLAIFVGISIAYPKVYEYAYMRIVDAPVEIMEARYEMNWTAAGIWRNHFLFGYGAANYLEALEDPDVTVHGPDWLPVHNAFLYTASEIGLVGVIAFFGILLITIFRCYKTLRHEDLFVRGLALAILCALFGYLLDGLTDPTFRQAVPYAILWIYIGITGGLHRLINPRGNQPESFRLPAA
jgi:hypothetical protein